MDKTIVTDKAKHVEPTPQEALAAVRAAAEELVADSPGPYEIGRDIHSVAMLAASGDSPEAEHCWALWLLWGALTDWVERKPDERPEAEESMRRAANEWLELSDGESAWRRYFDHWLYSEMGLERPKDAPAAPPAER
jgi:hypothetical protein